MKLIRVRFYFSLAKSHNLRIYLKSACFFGIIVWAYFLVQIFDYASKKYLKCVKPGTNSVLFSTYPIYRTDVHNVRRY